MRAWVPLDPHHPSGGGGPSGERIEPKGYPVRQKPRKEMQNVRNLNARCEVEGARMSKKTRKKRRRPLRRFAKIAIRCIYILESLLRLIDVVIPYIHILALVLD